MRAWTVLAGIWASGLSLGCGGGTPLLHPAHPLPPDQISFGAGVSHNVVFGEAESQIEDAKNVEAAGGVTAVEEREDQILTGALAESMTSPGLAPWVGARAGLGYDSDAGLTYTGRSARVDARHAFVDGPLALSVGLGLSRRFFRTSQEGEEGSGSVPGVDTSEVTGVGVDLPVIVGYRSPGGLISVYGGLRGHFEQGSGDVPLQIFADPSEVRIGELSATRFGGSGLVGMMIGVAPIWVALEASVGLFHGEGSVKIPGAPAAAGQPQAASRAANAEWTAPIVSPAGALITRF